LSEAQKLRDKAAHARRLAASLTDRQACGALETLAGELDQQASDLERQARAKVGQEKSSQSDTP
jgi:hypothetical protein